MTKKEKLIRYLKYNLKIGGDYSITDKDAVEIIKALEQEPLCDRLAREYISKVKYCDECFASTFCTINGLRNSRVPQSYCIENIKKYFESKSEG